MMNAVARNASRFGTGRIGGIFGPFMLFWFEVLGLLGFRAILTAPEVLATLNPCYALSHVLTASSPTSLAVLSAVFVAVTEGGRCTPTWATSVGSPSGLPGSSG